MAQPLATLDEHGTATVISYDVPEPISYSGRNFVELTGLPPEAYTTVVVAGGQAPAGLANSVEGAASALPSNASAAVIDISARPASPAPEPGADSSTQVSTGPGSVATASMIAPESVVLAGGAPQASPIVASLHPISDRLARLTNADVHAAAVTDKQVVVFPDVSGRLNYRLVAKPELAIALAGVASNLVVDGDGGRDPVIPSVTVLIGSPAPNAVLHGTKAGVTFAVSGTWDSENLSGAASLSLSVDGGTANPITPRQDGTWSAAVTITASGSHTLVATIQGAGFNSITRRTQNVSDRATVMVSVTLDPQNNNPPPVLPTVAITAPSDNTMLVNPAGLATVTVTGTATYGPGRTLQSVVVTDESTSKSTPAGKVGNDLSNWSLQLLLNGVGRHKLTVKATDDQGYVSSPQSVTAQIIAQPPFRRLKNRLLLVETLNLSSFPGAFGASRVIKTFSLLPGEKTTLSVKSWTKSADSSKAGSSIVDSDATEAASDFEDTLSAEQTSKESQTETANYKVGASAGATWAWGSASINAEYSGSANSVREEAVKNVRNATRKHSMKASSNRNVTINTEYTASHEAGTEESTTREISNINVSRTLNFVFRQMNQEHITLIHLTNVRVAYYTEDLMLDPQGNPAYVDDPITQTKVLDIHSNYTEVPLPQLARLLADVISAAWRSKVRDAIIFALSGIPDYQDTLQTLVEVVTPKGNDGKPVDGATYMRFPPRLQTAFVDPVSKQTINVPGIVLAYDHIVMRTDGVMVDTVIGQGDGLDAYSHGLQEAAVEERRMILRERQAELDRLALARQLVQNKDKDGTEIFVKLFPPQPQVPVLEIIQGQPSPNGPGRPK